MKIRASRLSNIYFICSVFILCFAESLNMRALEGVDARINIKLIYVFTLLVWGLSIFKIALPSYKLYKPAYPIFIYSLFFIWSLIPTLFTKNLSFTEIAVNITLVIMPMFVLWTTYNSAIQSCYRKSEKSAFLFMFIILVGQYVFIFKEITFLSIVHIGSSFFLLYLLPLILTFNSRLIKITATTIVILTLFISMKRSGVLALGISLFFFIFIRQYVLHKFNPKSFIGSLITVFVVGMLFVYLGSNDSNKENVFERFENIEKDKGSGRLEVWEITSSMIVDQDIIKLFVGNGYNTVLRDSRLQLSAHNDFLEVAYDYGLIGLFLYVCAFISLGLYIVKMILTRSKYAPSAAMLFIIYSAQSLISHIIIYYWANIIMLSFGYIIALYQVNSHISPITEQNNTLQQRI